MNEDNQWIRLVLKMIDIDENGIIELLQHAKTNCSFTIKVNTKNARTTLNKRSCDVINIFANKNEQPSNFVATSDNRVEANEILNINKTNIFGI